MSRHSKFYFCFLRASTAPSQPRNEKIVLQYLFYSERNIFLKIMKVAFIGADVDADLSPGDKVIVSKYAGTDVKLEDGTYSIVRQNVILGVLEE